MERSDEGSSDGDGEEGPGFTIDETATQESKKMNDKKSLHQALGRKGAKEAEKEAHIAECAILRYNVIEEVQQLKGLTSVVRAWY